MGNRLSKIVTRTGDRGQTGLGSGLRVDKDSPPIETLGTIDELNSWLGAIIALATSAEVQQTLLLAQHDLFDLGAQVSVPGTPLLSDHHVSRIDQSFEAMNADLGMLKEFILPGGATSSAFAHIARTVCRRAERRLFSLSQIDGQTGTAISSQQDVFEHGLAYLNRLSDLLFVVSRLENRASDRPDILWERGKSLSQGAST